MKTISIRKYPIGIQNFEKIRKENYLYIDKTDLMYQLVKTGSYYFLSRPRRFGKSLLISTLEAYFKGKKELFEGLAVEQLEKDWIQYPVIHIDLNAKKFDTEDDLIRLIDRQLLIYEAQYGSSSADQTIDDRLFTLIRLASEKTGQRVVILIDEYDKPMLQAIDNEELQNEYRNTLKAFYGVMKSMDKYIQFAFLTGVTKFGKVSVFSDLNNLNDISMWKPYVSLCGINEEELHRNFEDDIQALASALDITYEKTCTDLKASYDGYHFVENSQGIYNPFSLLNTFEKKKFGSYWFETGTPTYLVKLLQNMHYDLYRMAHTETDADVLNSIEAVSRNPIPVIYQSGYLTIKGYDKTFGLYRLGFPNKEVEEGFIKYLLPYYTPVSQVDTTFQIKKFAQEVYDGNYDAFFRRLQSFFADTPYELVRDQELHYQNVLFIVFKLLGFYVKAEYHTSKGRIDLILQTDRFIYVMEFKLDGTAEEALQQIDDKGYTLPFASDPRTLFRIGVNFSAHTRNIEKWLVKENNMTI